MENVFLANWGEFLTKIDHLEITIALNNSNFFYESAWRHKY